MGLATMNKLESQTDRNLTQKSHLFGMQIDAVTMPQAVEKVLDWSRQPFERCRYVVTPNVDHAVLFQEQVGLRNAYEKASLVLADGFPVVLASKLLGQPVPERVPGSDLVPKIFESSCSCNQSIRVFLLGAAEGVADRAASKIQKKWPTVNIVGTLSPPPGFHEIDEENESILNQIKETSPDILVVGLGAPKQELWIHRFHERIHAKSALCVGATIDFLAGEKQRAPRWIQSLGLEWLHRVCSEPKRLAKRYARDAWIFPQLIVKQFFDPSSAHRSRT